LNISPNTRKGRGMKMTARKTIWLFGVLLLIAVLFLSSIIAQAQEATRVTMGPWRALKNAGEITLYLEIPPGYSIDETRETQEGGPLLYMRGPATEHQKVWRSKGRGIFVGVYSVSNPKQMSLQQLVEEKVQKLQEQFEEPEYVIEPLEDGVTTINGYEVCYAFNVLKHMEVVETYGHPLTTCDLDIYIRLDDYHPRLPDGDLYLHIKCDFMEIKYPEEDIPVLKEDLDHVFRSMQIEVGVTPTGGSVPIGWIIVPIVVIIVVVLVLLYFRRREGG